MHHCFTSFLFAIVLLLTSYEVRCFKSKLYRFSGAYSCSDGTFWSQSATFQSECAVICSEEVQCRSFFYDRSTSTCKASDRLSHDVCSQDVNVRLYYVTDTIRAGSSIGTSLSVSAMTGTSPDTSAAPVTSNAPWGITSQTAASIAVPKSCSSSATCDINEECRDSMCLCTSGFIFSEVHGHCASTTCTYYGTTFQRFVGYINTAQLQTVNSATVESCKQECLTYSGAGTCLSFELFTNTNTCYLFSVNSVGNTLNYLSYCLFYQRNCADP